jgi:copper chaperone CopZ
MLPGTPRTFIGSTTFTVRGLTDARSRQALVTRVTAVDGVDTVSVDLVSGAVTVRVSRPVDRADIGTAVERSGFTLLP